MHSPTEHNVITYAEYLKRIKKQKKKNEEIHSEQRRVISKYSYHVLSKFVNVRGKENEFF